MSLTCPHCNSWTAECEDLPEEQDERKLIACRNCERVFAISWRVEHRAETIEEAERYRDISPQDIEDALEEVR